MSDAEIVPFQPREPQPAADVSYEVALDEPPTAEVELVDPAPVAGALLPVIPANLQTLRGVKREVARQAGRQLHRVKYHGVRSPGYLAQATLWAAVGAVKAFGKWLHWWLVPVPASVHADAIADGHRAWKSTFNVHKQTVKFRATISAVIGVPLLAGFALMWTYSQWWWWALLCLVVVPILARHGRPSDKRIISRATVTPRFRVINADVVLRAYYAAKLGDPEKPGMQVEFGLPPMSRDGDGSRVTVDLPYGLGLKDAINARDKIASGLDVQISQVFIKRDPTSNRRHTLWVADRDPLAVPVGRTPLLACKQTDIWKAAPLGLDERGQLVTVPLLWNSVLISALPRAGKTFSARLLGLFAALDPYVRLDVFDAKGSPDWRKFALVADSCAFGLTPTKDGLPVETLLGTLRAVKEDVQDRYQRLSQLEAEHPELCPEGKLTRKLARDPRFNMPIRVVVLEEFQEYYDVGPASKEISELLVFLAKVAPGAGVILIGSTQKPSGLGGTSAIGTNFNNFRDNLSVRFGLRTSSWQVSDICLGAGAYSEGLDTSALLVDYKGVGILRGAGDESPTVRCYYADGQDATRILTAARTLRERAGTLTGYAAGVVVDKPVRNVLGDVLAVFGDDPGLQWPVLTARLKTRFPDRWADATAESVSADCRGLGVPSVDVRWASRSIKGCRRSDVERVSAT